MNTMKVAVYDQKSPESSITGKTGKPPMIKIDRWWWIVLWAHNDWMYEGIYVSEDVMATPDTCVHEFIEWVAQGCETETHEGEPVEVPAEVVSMLYTEVLVRRAGLT